MGGVQRLLNNHSCQTQLTTCHLTACLSNSQRVGVTPPVSNPRSSVTSMRAGLTEPKIKNESHITNTFSMGFAFFLNTLLDDLFLQTLQLFP